MPTRDDAPSRIEGGGDLAGFLLSNLTATLRHHDPDGRRIAVKNLGRVGPAASTAIPELIRMMKEDPEAELRRLAADALAGVGQRAVQAFRGVLGDSESLVRVIAAYTLWMVRRDASGAAALERIVEGPDDPQRELASQVLGLIRMGSKEDE
ncbi:MAG TPA: HEAT repeat domain-containing protein [Verrucomicrobiae bacterium]|nr:HEAT repeat domain-containing protein [Verrucomicrobiae bacterium]